MQELYSISITSSQMFSHTFRTRRKWGWYYGLRRREDWCPCKSERLIPIYVLFKVHVVLQNDFKSFLEAVIKKKTIGVSFVRKYYYTIYYLLAVSLCLFGKFTSNFWPKMKKKKNNWWWKFSLRYFTNNWIKLNRKFEI